MVPAHLAYGVFVDGHTLTLATAVSPDFERWHELDAGREELGVSTAKTSFG
jgi:hypothetical protein